LEPETPSVENAPINLSSGEKTFIFRVIFPCVWFLFGIFLLGSWRLGSPPFSGNPDFQWLLLGVGSAFFFSSVFSFSLRDVSVHKKGMVLGLWGGRQEIIPLVDVEEVRQQGIVHPIGIIRYRQCSGNVTEVLFLPARNSWTGSSADTLNALIHDAKRAFASTSGRESIEEEEPPVPKRPSLQKGRECVGCGQRISQFDRECPHCHESQGDSPF
jgi:hypothetical protein